MRNETICSLTRALRACAALSLMTVLTSSLPAQSITWLGTLGGNWSQAYGVSADGSVVVGEYLISGSRRAFRWTALGGMQDLGALPDYSSIVVAEDVSADGRVVVGTAYDSSGYRRAFR
jgi:probable HAF family extracellular repeat protein